MSLPEIVSRKVADLIPYARNARTHSDAQVAQIAASIREFGWTNPILLDGQNGIIAGHGRLMAARKLSITDVPCIELAGLTEAQRKAYILADNKLALNAGWDDEMLRLELGELAAMDFDMMLTGFSDEDLLGTGKDENQDDTEIDAGIDYKEKFSIIVECSDEADQESIFLRLTSDGYKCKVLVN